MSNTASLKISVETSDVKKANDELNKLSNTSGKTEKSTQGVTTSFLSLGRVLSSIAILGTTQQFIKMADTMTGVESKLKLVTKNTFDLTIAQQELFEISQKTRQGYAETVNTYSNFALAMGEMGKSQKDILRVTETVNKAIAISGGTAQMSAAATMQLGQAFASGTLRGDELNSILENSKGLAQAIADGMGVPIGKLRTLGSEGKITAEILATALEKSAQSVDDKFGKVGITVEASMIVLANSITNMIGKVDKQLGATGSLGKLITDVSKHIDENTQYWVNSVQEAMDTMYPIAEAGFTNIRDLSEVTFEGVNALFSVMVNVFDGAIDSMDSKYRELGFFDYMSLGFIVVIEGFRQIASGGLSALTFLGKQFNTFQSIALDAIAGVMGAMGKFQNAVGGDGSAFLEAQAFWANKANKVKQDGLLIDRTQKAILDDMGKGVDRLIGSYDKLALKKVKAKEVDTGVGGNGKPKTNTETDEQKKAREKAEKAAEAAAKKEADRVKGLSEEISKLKIENDNDVLKNQMDNDAKAYQDAIKKREEELVKFKGIKGAEIEINREFNNTVESLNKNLVDKRNIDEIASSTEMYQIMNELSGNWYANEIVNISNRAAAFVASGQSNISVLKYIAEATQAIDSKLAIQSIDEMNDALFETKDILSGFNDFGANLDGIAGKIGNIAKTISDMSKNNARFINQDIANQKKYAKAFLSANGDIEKEKLAQFELDRDSAKLIEEKQNAEIAGYASLAGAMASAFQEGSAGAIAFTTLQSALGIASSWTAIAKAWALGFPQSIPAVATVTSAVMPIISQLGGSGSSGGSSVTGGQRGVDYQYNKDMIDTTYTPITDRLDRQISLLESIDKQGSASALGVVSSGISFQRDIQKWVQEVLSQSVQGALGIDSNQAATQAIVDVFNQAYGKNLYTVQGDNIFADYSMLQSSSDVISALLTSVNTGVAGIFGLLEDYQKIKFESQSTKLLRVVSELNDLQNIIGDWASGIMGSMDDLKSASKDFKGYFDDITGTMFYETQRINQAFNEVSKLTGKQSLSSYLQNTIKDIDALQSFFTQDTFTLLMSNNLDDIEAQINALDRLSEITGKTFEGGAREALDYLESIQLVSEAMATSRNNINDFVSSLRTSEENTSILASSIGVTLATNVSELSSLFNRLAYDTNGLTDADLELLNANKDLLLNTEDMQKSQEAYNKTLQDTTQSISVLQSALGTISSAIEKLRSASRTSEQNLQAFYDAMAEAQRLSKTDDYAGYAEAVKKAADTSSALFNKDNFALTRDMEYAQVVAANQFNDLQDTTLTQVDYLKQIEINTRTQIDVLVAAIDALGVSINESLLKSISGSDIIGSTYQNMLGRTADTSGQSYWQNQIISGAVPTSSIGIAVGTAGVANQEISKADFVTKLYTEGLNRTPTQEEVNYWANESLTPTTDLPSLFASLDPNFHSFAVGTANVPYDMLAQIHKDEIITPAPFSEGLRNGTLMMGNQTALIAEIQSLRADVSNLLKVNNSYQEKIDRNTKQNLFQGVV